MPHVDWGGVDNISWDPQPGDISLNDGMCMMATAVK